MKIKRVMTKNTVAVRPDHTIHDLLKILSENNISGCPVVNKNGKLVGIIGQTDVIKLIDVYSKIHKNPKLLPMVIASVSGGKMDSIVSKILSMKVKEFMQKEVVTISHDERILDAAKLMNKHDIDRLPVVENSKLVGIITRADIIKSMEKSAE